MAFLIFVRSFRINAFVWQEREDISKNEEVAPQSENNPQYVKSRSSADCEQSETFILKSEANLHQSVVKSRLCKFSQKTTQFLTYFASLSTP